MITTLTKCHKVQALQKFNHKVRDDGDDNDYIGDVFDRFRLEQQKTRNLTPTQDRCQPFSPSQTPLSINL